MQGTHSGANPFREIFRALTAIWYRGAIVRPVEQITIAGNFFRLLRMWKP